MDDGRQHQLAIFRRQRPEQRLEQASRLTACVLEAWDQRLRRQHPNATRAELRALRVAEALRFAKPSLPT